MSTPGGWVSECLAEHKVSKGRVTVNATRLKGQITADRRLVVDKIPDEMTLGEVEIIVLQTTGAKTNKRPAARKSRHPAFGLWTERRDVTDAVTFAA